MLKERIDFLLTASGLSGAGLFINYKKSGVISSQNFQ